MKQRGDERDKGYYVLIPPCGKWLHMCHAASGWRIHCGVEVTELSTNKQHSLSIGVWRTCELRLRAVQKRETTKERRD